MAQASTPQPTRRFPPHQPVCQTSRVQYSLSQFDLIFVDRVFWLTKVIKDKEYETELNEAADGIILVGRADVADDDLRAGDVHEGSRDGGHGGIDLREEAGDPFGDGRRVGHCRRHVAPRVHTDSGR